MRTKLGIARTAAAYCSCNYARTDTRLASIHGAENQKKSGKSQKVKSERTKFQLDTVLVIGNQ